jgi:glycosyltransferase involved in cell wall biosynthesis
LSVVVITRNEGEELRRTVENLEDTLPEGGEIVVVDDGSTDGSADHLAKRRSRVRLKRGKGLGVARARNWGARESRGAVVVFADAHIRVERLWWRPLMEVLEDPKVGGAAPAVTHLKTTSYRGYGLRLTGPELDVRWLTKRGGGPAAVPILPGCLLAMRREVFDATGGWDEGMLLRGGVDNEGCVRFWLFGYELMIVPEVLVRHQFRKKSPYPVDWGPYIHNRLRLAFAHLSPNRLGKVVSALRNHDAFGEALALLVERNISSHRPDMMSRRVRSDDWYFERFGMRW